MEKIREFLRNKENTKNFLMIMILFIFQLIVCIWFGYQKQTFFCDEVYSYGTANSEKYTFLLDEINYNPIIDNEEKHYLIEIGQKNKIGWFSSQIFRDYVTSDIKHIFKFKQAYINQVRDNHPPLYLFLLHIASSFSGEKLTKWTGISLNLIILFFMNIAFFYVAREFLQNNKKAILAMILWSFCAAGISNIIFIRMYFLLTFEIMLYIAAHINLLKKDGNCSLWNYAAICGIFIAGGLTHYHFYVFAVIFSFAYFCFLLYQKQKVTLIKYILSVTSGLIFNSLFFPALWTHIFKGVRGVQAFALLGTSSPRSENIFLTHYMTLINNSLLGNSLLFIFLFIIFFYLYKSFKNENTQIKEKITFNLIDPLLGIVLLTTTLFLHITTQGSGIIHNRYIYPMYPILAIIVVAILFHVLDRIKTIQNNKYILCFLIIAAMCFNSIILYGIDFQYKDYKEIIQKVDSTKGYDCMIYIDNNWRDIYTYFPIKLNYDEIYYLQENNIANIDNILEQRKTKNNLVIDLPSYLSLENQVLIMDKILKKTKYKEYYLIYSTEYSDIYGLF